MTEEHIEASLYRDRPWARETTISMIPDIIQSCIAVADACPVELAPSLLQSRSGKDAHGAVLVHGRPHCRCLHRCARKGPVDRAQRDQGGNCLDFKGGRSFLLMHRRRGLFHLTLTDTRSSFSPILPSFLAFSHLHCRPPLVSFPKLSVVSTSPPSRHPPRPPCARSRCFGPYIVQRS